ncbi:MAG: hypothetical protein M3R04_06260, partial [bacterium]|nr:hypothetical protein [bacterium]
MRYLTIIGTLALSLAFMACSALAAPVGSNECVLSDAVKADLLRAWEIALPELREQTETGLAASNPNCLYLLAQHTQPFIGAARDCRMKEELDELAELYLIPFTKLSSIQRGGERFDAWLCGGPDCPSWSEGAEPFEVILYSCQLLYAA